MVSPGSRGRGTTVCKGGKGAATGKGGRQEKQTVWAIKRGRVTAAT
jgi:hypothetical protein